MLPLPAERPRICLAMESGQAPTSPTGGSAAAVASPSSLSSSLIFLGTGCSGALPDARCLIQPSVPPCAVCSTALSLQPDRNPNYRCALCSHVPIHQSQLLFSKRFCFSSDPNLGVGKPFGSVSADSYKKRIRFRHPNGP